MKKVIVTGGWGVRYPGGGGMQWLSLHYLAGLKALGIEGFWLDLFNSTKPDDLARIESKVAEFNALCHRFGLDGHWASVFNRRQFYGMTESELQTLCSDCDLLLNLCGALKDEDLLRRIKRRAYFDLDPGFTQIWAQQCDMGFGRHNLFFTIGLNIGQPEFPIPTGGVAWQTLLPPVALEYWPAQTDVPGGPFTTIAQWRGQEAVWQNEYYGPKAEEFGRFIELPRRTTQPMELALLIHESETDDIARLRQNGWQLVQPGTVAAGVDGYRGYIQRSRAEFSVAKNGYVKAGSGWVSDRTICYLASGRPAVVQDTGFGRFLPTGRGLLTFTTIEEALAGIDAINADYAGHSAAARRLVEEHFAAPKVVAGVLERAGVI